MCSCPSNFAGVLCECSDEEAEAEESSSCEALPDWFDINKKFNPIVPPTTIAPSPSPPNSTTSVSDLISVTSPESTTTEQTFTFTDDYISAKIDPSSTYDYTIEYDYSTATPSLETSSFFSSSSDAPEIRSSIFVQPSTTTVVPYDEEAEMTSSIFPSSVDFIDPSRTATDSSFIKPINQTEYPFIDSFSTPSLSETTTSLPASSTTPGTEDDIHLNTTVDILGTEATLSTTTQESTDETTEFGTFTPSATSTESTETTTSSLLGTDEEKIPFGGTTLSISTEEDMRSTSTTSSDFDTSSIVSTMTTEEGRTEDSTPLESTTEFEVTFTPPPPFGLPTVDPILNDSLVFNVSETEAKPSTTTEVSMSWNESSQVTTEPDLELDTSSTSDDRIFNVTQKLFSTSGTTIEITDSSQEGSDTTAFVDTDVPTEYPVDSTTQFPSTMSSVTTVDPEESTKISVVEVIPTLFMSEEITTTTSSSTASQDTTSSVTTEESSTPEAVTSSTSVSDSSTKQVLFTSETPEVTSSHLVESSTLTTSEPPSSPYTITVFPLEEISSSSSAPTTELVASTSTVDYSSTCEGVKCFHGGSCSPISQERAVVSKLLPDDDHPVVLLQHENTSLIFTRSLSLFD